MITETQKVAVALQDRTESLFGLAAFRAFGVLAVPRSALCFGYLSRKLMKGWGSDTKSTTATTTRHAVSSHVWLAWPHMPEMGGAGRNTWSIRSSAAVVPRWYLHLKQMVDVLLSQTKRKM